MSDKALVHEQGIRVIVNEETGNTVLAEPIIEDLQWKIEGLEGKIIELEEKIKDSKNSDKKVLNSQRKKLRKQTKEHEAEIKEICRKCEKLIILDNRIILMLAIIRDDMFHPLFAIPLVRLQPSSRPWRDTLKLSGNECRFT